MLDKRFSEASPVLSVLAAEGWRVTGKTAKERPRREKEKRSFDHYLRREESAGLHGENGHVGSEGVDTLA